MAGSDGSAAGQRFATPPRALSRAAFLAAHGAVYEHSPWIAEVLLARGLASEHDTVEGLHAALAAIVDAAPHERQLALLRAHPDLAGRLAVRGELSAHSAAEQAGAGLAQCSPEEFARFTALNGSYRTKFGFPFVMAVKGKRRDEILAAFERRLGNDAATEFATALAEVHKIALLRLQAL
jgi:OHCU decarboxylase